MIVYEVDIRGLYDAYIETPWDMPKHIRLIINTTSINDGMYYFGNKDEALELYNKLIKITSKLSMSQQHVTISIERVVLVDTLTKIEMYLNLLNQTGFSKHYNQIAEYENNYGEITQTKL